MLQLTSMAMALAKTSLIEKSFRAASRLEVDGSRDTHRPGRRDLHSAFGDRIAPWHTELIHAAIRATFHADDLVELRGIEIDRSRSTGWRRRRRERRLTGLQRLDDRARQLGWITVAADMHVECRRVATKDMIVDRRDLQAILNQHGHDGVDLGLEKHEVAHHHRSLMRGLHRDPAAEREGGFDRDAVDRHRQIGAREAVSMNVA